MTGGQSSITHAIIGQGISIRRTISTTCRNHQGGCLVHVVSLGCLSIFIQVVDTQVKFIRYRYHFFHELAGVSAIGAVLFILCCRKKALQPAV